MRGVGLAAIAAAREEELAVHEGVHRLVLRLGAAPALQFQPPPQRDGWRRPCRHAGATDRSLTFMTAMEASLEAAVGNTCASPLWPVDDGVALDDDESPADKNKSQCGESHEGQLQPPQGGEGRLGEERSPIKTRPKAATTIFGRFLDPPGTHFGISWVTILRFETAKVEIGL